MNKELFETQWAQNKTFIKDKFSNLTDEDIRQINGRYDQLINRLQQRYGYTREEAEAQLSNWTIDRARTYGEKSYARGERETDETWRARSRDEDNSSIFKWILGVGIPLLLLGSWLAYDSSRTADTTNTAAGQNSTFMLETPEDRAISQNILRAFVSNNQLSPAVRDSIRIETANGVVTVRGTVPTTQDRDLILSIVDRVSGIRQVNNQLQVAR